MTLGLALAAVLAVACVLGVALPFLRDPTATDDNLDALSAEERELLSLAEERDRALTSLKELEADHRAGRVSDEDYRSAVSTLRSEAAAALRAVDAARARGVSDAEANIRR